MKERLIYILQLIEDLGGEARPLIFEEPAQYDDIYDIEQQLPYKIPDDFKNILLTVSSRCEFSWFLPKEFNLPHELRNIFSGDLHGDWITF